MIHELPGIMMATVDDAVGSYVIPVSEGQQIEILKIKLNEAIRHINNLEEKLLSSDDLIE